LLVISIIVVLVTISAPLLLKKNPDQVLRATLTELELLCHCAQQAALASNQEQRVVIDQKRKCCSFQLETNHWKVDLPEQYNFGFAAGTLGPPGEPFKKITQAVTFPAHKELFFIDFKPTGVVSAGTAYIIDKYAGCMGALTCGVSQVSCIKTYGYYNHRWQLLNPKA
jgi:hypothetical protein